MAFSFSNENVCGVEVVAQAVERCPFLRNIAEPTAFSFSSLSTPSFNAPSSTQTNATRGPIFEDGHSFNTMFRLFHGRDGVVPLAEGRSSGTQVSNLSKDLVPDMDFHPLAATAASISLSSFGGGGPFSFDAFMGRNNLGKSRKKEPKKKNSSPEESANESKHEMGSEWLTAGNCPIAKSYRAVSAALPLVAKALTLPPGLKYKCPPAIVAARAALAKTPAVKVLRPQALPTKILAIGALGMALNVPLGIWREHTKKFSPEWFVAVHASVPFIAMLRKAVVMPKYAMAFTIASAILGQVIGSRAERSRLKTLKSAYSTQQECSKEAWVSEKASLLESTYSNSPLPGSVAVCQDKPYSPIQAY